MVTSAQIAPGMTLLIEGKLWRVDSATKVTLAKGQPFVKTKLRALDSEATLEKNFKVGQEVEVVTLEERKLEFLYLEGKSYLFLDPHALDEVPVPAEIIGTRAQFLKEGTELQATFYGATVFSVELPQFLELMVAKTDPAEENHVTNATKQAILETGATIMVPAFVETGDVIKFDTMANEYVQRV